MNELDQFLSNEGYTVTTGSDVERIMKIRRLLLQYEYQLNSLTRKFKIAGTDMERAEISEKIENVRNVVNFLNENFDNIYEKLYYQENANITHGK